LLTIALVGFAVLYAATAALLFYLLPGPHQQFECMVIGAGSTGIAMFAVFASCVMRSRS